MIDPELVRRDPDRIRRSQEARGESTSLVDDLSRSDAEWRSSTRTFEDLRAKQRELGRVVANAAPPEKQALIAESKSLAAEVRSAQERVTAARSHHDTVARQIGNIVADGVPAGGEDDAVVIETVGEPRDLQREGFEVRDHLELGRLLGGIDVERGAKVSGSRFFFLTGQVALLQFALSQYALSKAVEYGFTPMIPPVLVKPAAMDGTGFLGQAADDVYRLERDDLYLVGTSEVPIAAYHGDEILDEGSLPLSYAGFSTVFRREAGSYGRDTRGIFRVHQFDKWELFVLCDLQESQSQHQRLLNCEKDFLQSLGLPFQVLDVAAGDLGQSASRKFDCYAWLPSQQRYREVTSASDCTDFQSRRLNIRARIGGSTVPVATLNGTLSASARMVIMLLENHQQADGSVTVPEVLQPYLGGKATLEPVTS